MESGGSDLGGEIHERPDLLDLPTVPGHHIICLEYGDHAGFRANGHEPIHMAAERGSARSVIVCKPNRQEK